MTAASPFVPSGSVPIALHAVEAELARQMKTLQGAGEHPVQYARVSNLVIFCEQREQAESLAAEVPNVVSIHPARVLLLLGESSLQDAALTAAALVRPRQNGAAPGGASATATELLLEHGPHAWFRRGSLPAG